LADDVSVFAFDADSAGEWMYHCHIYDHINAGMMGHLEVQEVE
jgi:FtsP/CotA-like multicopper oxidase with cupredoxin domain